MGDASVLDLFLMQESRNSMKVKKKGNVTTCWRQHLNTGVVFNEVLYLLHFLIDDTKINLTEM